MIQARIAKLTDWTYALLCFPGVGLFGWGSVLYLANLKGIQWPPAIDDWPLWVVPPISVIATWLCACVAVGAAWRLSDHRAAFLADADGIVFHPSLHRRALTWRDVTAIKVEDNGFARLHLKLRARFWSLNWPLTSTEIVIPLTLTSLHSNDVYDVIARLRQWQNAGETQ